MKRPVRSKGQWCGCELYCCVRCGPGWPASVARSLRGARDPSALIVVSQQVFGRPFMAPPGVPERELNLLRAAFMATMKDPEFLADTQKIKLDINPRGGDEVSALIQKVYSAPKEVIERMKQALGR